MNKLQVSGLEAPVPSLEGPAPINPSTHERINIQNLLTIVLF